MMAIFNRWKPDGGPWLKRGIGLFERWPRETLMDTRVSKPGSRYIYAKGEAVARALDAHTALPAREVY
jgi:hypothetical protein